MKSEQNASFQIKENSSAANVEMKQFLTFTVENGEYGVDIMKVREIKGWEETTRLPNSSEHMRGVINLRGIVLPIFDLRTRFNMGKTEVTEKHVVIILAVGGRTIGILVDAVSDILTVSEDQIKNAPSEMDIDDAFIHGLISVEEKMIVLLEVETLFSEETLENAGREIQEKEKII